MNKFPDKEDLLKALQKYNRHAQREFFDEVYPKLVKFSFKMVKNWEDAREIASNRLEKYLAKVKEIQSYDQLTGQLFIAVRNFSINCIRDKKDWRKRLTDQAILDDIVDEDTQNEIEENKVEVFVRHFLTSFSSLNRKIAEYALFEEKSNSEIAELLNIDEKTVRNRKSRILIKLRKALVKAGLHVFF